uniref:Uncharacterized protein n=1 Tax=Parascaris equorum TaxID=6256 RepID=A0A914R6C0_PAREQ
MFMTWRWQGLEEQSGATKWSQLSVCSGDVKEKIRKAQSLYEPWMDNMAMVEESKEYVAPPPRHPHAKHRTPLNLVHVNDKLGLRKRSLQSAVPAQSRVEASRNSTVSIYLPMANAPEEPTPLPFDERRKVFVLVGNWMV